MEGGTEAGQIDYSERVLALFADALLSFGGFVRAGAMDNAYWRAEAVAFSSDIDPAYVTGVLDMRTIADFEGKAVRSSFLTKGKTRRQTMLYEISVPELDETVQGVAEMYFERLWPHTVSMCDDWRIGGIEEEIRLNKIREELTEEIERVRQERKRVDQEKRLRFEIEKLPRD